MILGMLEVVPEDRPSLGTLLKNPFLYGPTSIPGLTGDLEVELPLRMSLATRDCRHSQAPRERLPETTIAQPAKSRGPPVRWAKRT